VPSRLTATLRLEAKGRGGKRVTVVAGLPDNTPFLEDLARALRKACATGGAVRPGAIELAGDVRERLRPILQARGITAKG
jgi:translation initiation factor 1